MGKHVILLFLVSLCIKAQPSQQLNSGEILAKIRQFNTLANVLYVAAHPDDENTRLITHFAQKEGANVGYLSLTRGDGGQNLIGSEIGKELGIIRSQELLAARKIDGGQQFFTRAIDFGYSKTPEETFSFWGKEKIFKDVVLTIRAFRPDVIITRFSKEPGVTHGHHTASAILAHEAYTAASDPNKFPEQLSEVSPWKTSKLFWNTSSWFFRNREFEEDKYLKVDITHYLPEKGRSVTEIASDSRSQHKSQGFGASSYRNTTIEYLELWEGQNGQHVFDGIETSWKRLGGQSGEKLFELGNDLLDNYSAKNPHKVLPVLLQMKKEIEGLNDEYWRERKIKEVDYLIKQSIGLYLDATTAVEIAYPGQEIDVSFEITNRTTIPLVADFIEIETSGIEIPVNETIVMNTWSGETTISLSQDVNYTSPYWLVNTPEKGIYTPEKGVAVNLPEQLPEISAQFHFTLEGEPFVYSMPIMRKERDPVIGELYQNLAVLPKVYMESNLNLLLFNSDEPRDISISVTSMEELDVTPEIIVPGGWKINNESLETIKLKKGIPSDFTFSIQKTDRADEGALKINMIAGDGTYNKSVVMIQYDHIPAQYFVSDLRIQLVPLDIKTRKKKIGYIEGAGDDIPSYLSLLGYQVLPIDLTTSVDFDSFETIILGIRAYNTNEGLARYSNQLFDYVKGGGTLITQYNNSFNLVTNDYSPLQLNLSRLRVTDENSPLRLLEKDHPVWYMPNQITLDDFNGWSQERGLYFPSDWSDSFIPLLELNDPREESVKGSLLIADYGKGKFIYTGLSFFRQFPAGVEGAFKLFANLIEQ